MRIWISLRNDQAWSMAYVLYSHIPQVVAHDVYKDWLLISLLIFAFYAKNAWWSICTHPIHAPTVHTKIHLRNQKSGQPHSHVSMHLFIIIGLSSNKLRFGKGDRWAYCWSRKLISDRMPRCESSLLAYLFIPTSQSISANMLPPFDYFEHLRKWYYPPSIGSRKY